MTLSTTSLDQSVLRNAFGQFPSGVVAVCAEIDGVKIGMAASSFVAVSIDPPLVAFCVQDTSTTWPKFAAATRIGISVLGELHDVAARTLAAKTGNRFEGLTTTTTDDGAVFIDGASMWLDATVTEQITAGDHDIVLMRINELEIKDGIAPIVFHGSKFRRLAVDL
ncbi:flavin reductase family protein [Rhodococcus sp. IEGM 1401]|jgi:flavin reductase (DIM6/NTAB) family NADH-FMN oxidoreductase RutF|uniref:flavin reductase family protein n=1 Tax=unclassified Rhodococcus (in: high G+C Gram-positive bacteria) TaxID=192944 RepID=UPI001C90D351|nr:MULTISPECIES: flavin reductase family protein [unclassified Rhodococcus (in: high G+C Gram-positive bacteria)]MBY3986922.1 flavin reductase family protein [Rhodococcus fascians]MBY3996361.1 flavin reductase family protein [Rhodococcus fascians]MBY4002924.1 flavin reductase family protein [Rhodococcus fascians]MBY4007674.1 flavin reductase family protein [Rhodococcus fascians]MBY4017573.1 flavin reductase family protein [Rhodococcus fascians]